MQLQSFIFLIRCDKNPVIYDDPAPLSSFQYPSSIQSLILALFDSVLGPKKKILQIIVCVYIYFDHSKRKRKELTTLDKMP